MKTERKTDPKTGRVYFVTYGFDLDFAAKHNQAPYLSVTGEEWDGEPLRRSERNLVSMGCCHDTIRAQFPHVAPLLPFHGCSTTGPTHYPANAVFLAGERDHWGLLKGERRQRKNREGLPLWELAVIGNDDPMAVYHLRQMQHYGDRPTPAPVLEWTAACTIGDGKERELVAARSAACWPDATDAELSTDAETLRAVLLARLPSLLAQFRATCEAAGIGWPA